MTAKSRARTCARHLLQPQDVLHGLSGVVVDDDDLAAQGGEVW
ncbi:MAG: hypothetical protein ACOVN4_04350 [Bosea sp. (in: a-proteobacteria)]